MADQARRFADLVEAGDDFPQPYEFCDRGTHRPIDGWLEGGMAIVDLPNAGITLCLTPDRAEDLGRALLHWLDTRVVT